MKGKMEWKRKSSNKKQRKWPFALDQEHIHDLVQGSAIMSKNSCV